MFKEVRSQMQSQFNKIVETGEIFTIEVDRDKIWQIYLDSFPDEETKQNNNCNCCKSFLRQFGGIVGIDEKNQLITLWDFEAEDEEYTQAIKNLHKYVSSKKVSNIFFNKEKDCGTEKNFDSKRDVFWNHFYLTLPTKFVKSNFESIQGSSRDDKNVLERSLNTISLEAAETVIELIDQNSLYRGSEFKGLVQGFIELKKKYNKIKSKQKSNFCWVQSKKANKALCRIRNGAIGTLLKDLSEGRELDQAVTAFEKVVAPSNYKRPTALITPRMVENAQSKIQELGLTKALDRRLLEERDLNINNTLFIHRDSSFGDIFDELKNQNVQPKTLKKVEEVSVSDFIEKILPKAESIEALVENSHLSNFVSVIGPQSTTDETLFKWGNSISWSYSGEMADSMREQVVKLGGRVDGVLRFTHSWNHPDAGRNASLMDLHVFMPGSSNHEDGCHDKYPSGQRVGWNNRKDIASGGNQDVDYTNAAPANYIPIENISFPNLKKLKEGKYIFKIHNWQARNPNKSGFQAEIEFQGQIHTYNHPKPLSHKQWVTLAEVTLKNGVFNIEHKFESKSISKSKWNIDTNKFHKVKAVTLSPNYWNSEIGNKHFFFLLDKCHPDEKIRPFYNEFLKEDLLEHKKVFEVLGSKLKVEAKEESLAGIGFSETQRNHLYVKVKGKFERVIKIKF